MKGENTILIIALIALASLMIVPVFAIGEGIYIPDGWHAGYLGSGGSCPESNFSQAQIYVGDTISVDLSAGSVADKTAEIWIGGCQGSTGVFKTTSYSGVTINTIGSFTPSYLSSCGGYYPCGYGFGTDYGESNRVYLILNTDPRPPTADFTYSPAEPWIAPATVSFTDASTGAKADSWWWEASGTGFYSESRGGPVFNVTFPNPGSYQIGLSVVNGTDSQDSIIKTFNVLNEAGSYSLSMSPKTGTIATNYTATVTAGVDELGAVLNQFTISCSQGGSASICTTDGKDPIFIKQNDGKWYLDGNLYSATFPDEIPLKFNVPGIHTITAWFFTTDPTDTGTEASDEIEITSTPGQVKLTVEVRDGSNNALIAGSDILLKKEDGTWDNQTVGLGYRDYYVPGGNNIGIGATAPGYTTSSIEYNRFYENAKKVVLLSRITGGVPAGNNTLSVYVRKGGGADVVGLDGATVKLNDGQTKLTPGSGLVQFLVLDDETYFITVSKPGYITISKYFAVNGAVNAVTMDLLTPGVTTTATLGPGQTPAPGTTTLAPGTTYPPGVPMPGTATTYPPGVPVIGADGGSATVNGTAREIAVRNLDTWMIWGGTFLIVIFAVMLIGFSGDALKKWSWLWK